jgi:uncharacterized membrane protein YbhN (UPF0104 family)
MIMARVGFILGVVGTLGAFALAMWLIDWQALLAAFARMSSGVLMLASLFSVGTTLILAGRWAILAGGPRDRYGALGFHDALVGQVFNLVTPAAVGGDAYRVVAAGGRNGGHTRAMAMLVLERFVGLCAYAIAFLVAFAIGASSTANPLMNSAAIVFAAILVVLLAFIVAARYVRWRPIRLPGWSVFLGMHEAVDHVAILPGWRLLSAGALTLAALTTWLIGLGIIAHASGVGLPVHVIVMIAVVTECARLLPISIQGIGVREATFASLATQAGGAAAPAFAACATAYALHFLLSGVVGIAARALFDYGHLRRTG